MNELSYSPELDVVSNENFRFKKIPRDDIENHNFELFDGSDIFAHNQVFDSI